MPKIYVVGAVGSGKTTFAKKLSKELNIPYYELDNICWKPNGEGKRNSEEIDILFLEILKNDNWIIENVGSDFDKGFDEADTIIYLNISKLIVHLRIIRRWIKCKLGIAKKPFKSSFEMLKNEIKWSNKELNSKRKLEKLQAYKDKLVILNKKQAKRYKYKFEERS